MWELLLCLFRGIHGMHNPLGIVFLFLLPRMIYSSEYDHIEQYDNRYDDQGEEECDLGACGKEHD